MRARGSLTTAVLAAASTLGLSVATTSGAVAMPAGAWGAAVTAESITGMNANLNTGALEGCAFIAQREHMLYFASNRGGRSDLDIWYSHRQENGAWGAPVNFAAVNTSANELCPTAHRNGRTFLFVSDRAGGLGGNDIYATRLHATRGWSDPINLGSAVNSAAGEAGPSLVDDELYFSSNRAGGFTSVGDGAVTGDSDIYVSHVAGDTFHAATVVTALSTARNDFRPNLRRDGLEVFFDSNRDGFQGATRNLDLWSATRADTASPWSSPVNLGSAVNSSADDLRPTLSWDAGTLYFGSVRTGGEGSQDLYVTTR